MFGHCRRMSSTRLTRAQNHFPGYYISLAAAVQGQPLRGSLLELVLYVVVCVAMVGWLSLHATCVNGPRSTAAAGGAEMLQGEVIGHVHRACVVCWLLLTTR
jgi:hypothetical protein